MLETTYPGVTLSLVHWSQVHTPQVPTREPFITGAFLCLENTFLPLPLILTFIPQFNFFNFFFKHRQVSVTFHPLPTHCLFPD